MKKAFIVFSALVVLLIAGVSCKKDQPAGQPETKMECYCVYTTTVNGEVTDTWEETPEDCSAGSIGSATHSKTIGGVKTSETKSWRCSERPAK